MQDDRDLAREVDEQGRIIFWRATDDDGHRYFFALRLPSGDVFCLDALAVMRRVLPYLKRRRNDVEFIITEFADLWAGTEQARVEPYTPEVKARWDLAMARRRSIMRRNP